MEEGNGSVRGRGASIWGEALKSPVINKCPVCVCVCVQQKLDRRITHIVVSEQPSSVPFF